MRVSAYEKVSTNEHIQKCVNFRAVSYYVEDNILRSINKTWELNYVLREVVAINRCDDARKV